MTLPNKQALKQAILLVRINTFCLPGLPLYSYFTWCSFDIIWESGCKSNLRKMPLRCCVGGCKSNYDEEIERTGEVVPVFSFPSNKDRVRKRKLWFDSLPSVVEDTTSKRICIKHWPARYATVNRTGHEVPLDPPSVFGLPSSYCRQTIDQPRDVEVRTGWWKPSRSSMNRQSATLKTKIRYWEDLLIASRKD